MIKLELRDGKQETRKSDIVKDIRTDGETGIIEGYIAVWGQVDSYNSRFQKGAFKKTLENRTDKIRVIFNHNDDEPIGKLLHIEEDDYGVKVRAQLIMDVAKAKDTFSLIKGGAIDAFSFGFRTIKDKYEKGIQVITEVMLAEISPVTFPAGSASLITDARSTDFNETDKQNADWQARWRLIESLTDTLDDILWSDATEAVQLTEDAIDAFKASYMPLVTDLVGSYRSANELKNEFRKYCTENNTSIEQIALTTSLTVDELKTLKRGQNINHELKLNELSPDILAEHKEQRSKKVETLCTELRSGLSEAEYARVDALLNKSKPEVDNTITSFFDDFNNSLK